MILSDFIEILLPIIILHPELFGIDSSGRIILKGNAGV